MNTLSPMKPIPKYLIYLSVPAAAAVVTCAALALSTGLTAVTMRLTKILGQVAVSTDANQTLPSAANMRLYDGYRLETEALSYAWINLDNVKLTKLDEMSRASLRKKGKELEILLESGGIFFDVQKPLEDDESLSIRTSSMAVGIRGTSGWVRVIDDKTAILSVLEGTVQVTVKDPITGQTKTEPVNAGETVTGVVYEQTVPGDKCDILRDGYTREDIPGFVLVELAQYAPLTEKIYQASGMDLRDVTAQEAEKRLQNDEAERAQKLAQNTGTGGDDDGKQAQDGNGDSRGDGGTLRDTLGNTPGSSRGNTSDGSGNGQTQSGGQPQITPPGRQTGESGMAVQPDLTPNPAPALKPGTALGAASGLASGSSAASAADSGSGSGSDDSSSGSSGSGSDDSSSGSSGSGSDDSSSGSSGSTSGGSDSGDSGQTTPPVTPEPPAEPATYEVRFNLNNVPARVDAPSSVLVLSGETITVSVGDIISTSGDKMVAGWYTGTDFSKAKKWLFGVDKVTSDTTLYAKWCDKLGDTTWYSIDGDTLTIGGRGPMPDYSFDSTNRPPWDASARSTVTVKNLVIESGVTSIGYAAFQNRSDLESAIIGDSVTRIGWSAFNNCSALTSVNIPDSVTLIDTAAFYGCSSLKGNLSLPGKVTSIGNGAFQGCTSLTGSLSIPDSVTYIGGYAFQGCSGLTGSLTIGNSVIDISYSAFQDCSGLTGSLTIGNNVTSIGNSAFQGCSSLTGSLTIGNNITSIGDSAFQGCSGLTGNLSIPDKVTSIGERTFQGCSGLTGDLSIPDRVTSIGLLAFNGCTGLTGNLSIGNSVTSIGLAAFANCSGLTNLSIPNSVTSMRIGGSAFYGCTGFTSLNIPNSVTSIGSEAFRDCTSLTSLSIGTSVSYIDNFVFYNCSKLRTVDFRGTLAEWKWKSYPALYVTVNCSDGIRQLQGPLIWSFNTTTKTLAIETNASIPTSAPWQSYMNQITSITIPAAMTQANAAGFKRHNYSSSIAINYLGTQADWDAKNLASCFPFGVTVTCLGDSP